MNMTEAQFARLTGGKPATVYHALTILKMLVWIVSEVVTQEDAAPFERVYAYLGMMKQEADGEADGTAFYDSAIALVNAIEMDSGPVTEETINTLFSIRWWIEYTLRWAEGERLRPGWWLRRRDGRR